MKECPGAGEQFFTDMLETCAAWRNCSVCHTRLKLEPKPSGWGLFDYVIPPHVPSEKQSAVTTSAILPE